MPSMPSNNNSEPHRQKPILIVNEKPKIISEKARNEVIHLKYYKHLKKGAHQSHLGSQWAGFWQTSQTEISNKIGI